MPARHRQLSMGVLSEPERARIINHLTDRYGSVSQGLRVLVGRDLLAWGQVGLPALPHGRGNERPQVWVWPVDDREWPFAAIYCRYVDHPLLDAGEWGEHVSTITAQDDPELYALVTDRPGELLRLRRGKDGQWERCTK